MVDIALSSSRIGDEGGDAARHGLSTEIASLQACLEGCTCHPHPEHPSSLDEQAISVIAVSPRKAITSVPVSRLAFPFNLTSTSPRRQITSPAVSPPPTHRGFSRLPSPLAAGEDTVRAKAQPKSRAPGSRRHQHHGHSRQALLHTKWFWSSREEEWHEHKAAKPEAVSATSAGLRQLNALTNHPHCSRTMRPFDCHEQPSSEPPPSVFPRRGDITALRDSYCVEADQCFANVPIWTLSKVLWVHDMHALSAPQSTELNGPPSEADDDDAASEISFDTTASVGFSDDSESTLVDSETEWDSSSDDADGELKGRHSSSSQPASQGSSPSIGSDPPTPLAWAKDVYLKPPPTPQISRSESRSSPLNWYRRWELLLELSHSERHPEKSPPMTSKPLPKEFPKVPPPLPKVSSPPVKRLSFNRGLLTNFRKQPSVRSGRPSSYVVQDSFLDSSHPAAG